MSEDSGVCFVGGTESAKDLLWVVALQWTRPQLAEIRYICLSGMLYGNLSFFWSAGCNAVAFEHN